MRRTALILVWILLGALAAGLGTYVFLRKANDDRERLADIVVQAQQESKIAKETSQRTVAEANQKLNAANAEITKAQMLVKALKEERDLMASAKPLTAPTVKAIKGWKEVVNVALGISLKFPPTSQVELNDATSLTLAKTTESALSDTRWLSVTPYEQRIEQELITNFSTSTPVSYIVNGHLLLGLRGTMDAMADETFVLRVRKDGQDSHLIWARGEATKTLLDIFATLNFQK